jgi:DNA-directed RNA polymerase specialized sigma subunit
MKKTYHRWQHVRKKKLTPQQLEEIDRTVEQDLLAMDLQAVRELIGKTQADVAEVSDMTQSEVSRLERRPDVRLSTLKRFVEALGGEVEIFATFGDKRVRLRAAG